jgi:hypothetical protein
VNRDRNGHEILLRLSLQKIGPHLVQHVAEPVGHFQERTPTISNGPASPCSSHSSSAAASSLTVKALCVILTVARGIGNTLY